MTDPFASAGSHQEPAEAEGPAVIRDKRRIDPLTGEVRESDAQQGDSAMSEQTPAGDQPSTETAPEEEAAQPQTTKQQAPADDVAQPDAANDGAPSDADRAADLQDQLLREKASFHNYRELMKRERPKDREQAVGSVVEALLPVMDDVHYARQHGDLAGSPFEKIAEKLESTLGRFGVTAFGAAGDAFDPALHEALMNVEAELPPGATTTTVVQVMQPGYKVGERVVRPARVSVADPS